MIRPTLILGMGNLILSDEGVGVHVARTLQTMTLPEEVEVIDGGTGGFELIDFFRGRKRVIIVDCLLAPQPPGTIILAHPSQLDLQWTPAFSGHQGGMRELLTAADNLPNPPDITIVGIVPADAGRPGMTLSNEVSLSMERIVSDVLTLASPAALPRMPSGSLR